ncbi:hypothetical protein ENBRE01_2796 [Enteropsectra breve]|nr:hypothetical protein ENBRE01_2796 [Enteropsectra breve]
MFMLLHLVVVLFVHFYFCLCLTHSSPSAKSKLNKDNSSTRLKELLNINFFTQNFNPPSRTQRRKQHAKKSLLLLREYALKRCHRWETHILTMPCRVLGAQDFLLCYMSIPAPVMTRASCVCRHMETKTYRAHPHLLETIFLTGWTMQLIRQNFLPSIILTFVYPSASEKTLSAWAMKNFFKAYAHFLITICFLAMALTPFIMQLVALLKL